MTLTTYVIEIICPCCESEGIWWIDEKDKEYMCNVTYYCNSCEVTAHMNRVVPTEYSDLPHIIDIGITKL